MRAHRLPVAVYLASVAGLTAWLGLAEIDAWGLSLRLGELQHLWAMVGGTALLIPAWWAARRWRLGPAAELGMLLLGAVAVRVVLLAEPLQGTVDAYRYLWDGQVQAAGINPYLYAPVAEELAGLRDGPWYEQVFRPWLPTCYPPVAQAWFWVGYRLQPGGFFGFKLVLLLHELAAVPLLWAALRQRGIAGGQAVIYALSPLAAVQFMVGLHLDALYVPWLAAALLLHRRHPALAGVAVAMATGVRPLAVFAIPALAWGRPFREGSAVVVGALIAGLLALLPYADAGGQLLGSTLDYLALWEFNGAPYRLIKALTGDAFTARWIGYGLTLAVALWAWTRRRWRPSLRFLVSAGAYYALSPTLYPWYLVLILVPWIVVGGWAPLLLGGIVALSETVHPAHAAGGPWQVPWPWLAVEWGSLVAVVILDITLARRRRGSVVEANDVG